jgi:hypothetical protein
MMVAFAGDARTLKTAAKPACICVGLNDLTDAFMKYGLKVKSGKQGRQKCLLRLGLNGITDLFLKYVIIVLRDWQS